MLWLWYSNVFTFGDLEWEVILCSVKQWTFLRKSGEELVRGQGSWLLTKDKILKCFYLRVENTPKKTCRTVDTLSSTACGNSDNNEKLFPEPCVDEVVWNFRDSHPTYTNPVTEGPWISHRPCVRYGYLINYSLTDSESTLYARVQSLISRRRKLVTETVNGLPCDSRRGSESKK